MLGLSKLLIGSAVVLVPAGVIAGTTLFSAPPKSTPLNKSALNSFTAENGYKKCLTFLSADNKESLLFACFKKDIQQEKLEENEPTYYFYNGYSWNKAVQLTKQGNSNRISVKSANNSKIGEIYDSKNELKGLNGSAVLDYCDHNQKTNKLNCFNEDLFEESVSREEFTEKCKELLLFELEGSFEGIDSTFSGIEGLAQIELKEFQEESSSK